MASQVNSIKRLVAYFSMEIALENAMPSYSGGLGVLAGDTIRAAADLRLPMVAISLLYRKGYFTQRLGEDGSQTEEPVEWRVEDFLTEEPARASVSIENRRVELRCWRYSAKGVRGFEVPIYFLDADLPSNADTDRNLTGALYGGDSYYRLCQEVVLGIGGVRMLRALGYNDLTRYHMNEGHAALLALQLLNDEAEKAGRQSIRSEDIEKVRSKCVFTTHTPVPAGHDRFPMEYLTRVFPGQTEFLDLKDASSADLMKRVLQVEQDFPGLQEAARRNFPPDVSGNTDRGHHQRGARRHMDFACISATLRPLHSVVARGQLQFARRARAASGGSLGGASDRQVRFARNGSQEDRPQVRFRGFHHRVCAPRNRIQARRLDPGRSRPAPGDCQER